MPTVRVKTEGIYQSHSVKNNRALKIIMKFPYHELKNYIQSIQMLNENIKLGVRIGTDKKPTMLGTFMLFNLAIDRDGEAKITFDSMTDNCNMDGINELSSRADEPQHYLLKADIELEEEDNEEEEE